MRSNDNVIVIADDDAAICEAFKTMFAARGYTVHTCNDGLAAVALCKDVRPGVALIDLEMPGIDGYEVARRLRADVDLADTRLVAVTGRSDEQASARAWDAGFHDFLGKPAPVSMLLAMIRRTQEMQAIKTARDAPA
jgi:two-component system, sensor histidine kinase